MLFARHLISLVKPSLPAKSAPLRFLDNACSPLVQSIELFDDETITAHPEVYISATDTSTDFIINNQAFISANRLWNSNGKKIDTDVMNGMDLQYPDNTFDASFTSLAIFAFPDPVKGVNELYRTLKPGGVTALTTWKRVGWLPLLHAVERIVRPGKELTRFTFLEPWLAPKKLRQVLLDGGFEKAAEGEVMAHAWFEGEQMAAKCLSDTLKMLVGGGWSEEEKMRIESGFRDVLRKGGMEEAIKREGEKVGFEMVVWTGVGWK